MKESYAVDNDVGNHRLFFSQYITNEDEDENFYDDKNYTQNNHYKLRSDIPEKANKTDIKKRENNIVTNPNNNRKYNITKIKIKNTKEDENESKSNNKINILKNEPNYSEEGSLQNKIMEPNKTNSINYNINTQEIKDNSKDKNALIKSIESESKKEIDIEVNDESNPLKTDELFSSLGNEYKENESINNNQNENQNETNNKTKMRWVILEKKQINYLLYYLKIIISQIIIILKHLIDMKMNRKKIMIFRIIQIN